jgi:hypothetical protein
LKRLIFLILLLHFSTPNSVLAQDVGFYVRADCGTLNPVDNSTVCLQQTTANGRVGGITYVYVSGAWTPLSGGHTIEDEGVAVAQRETLNYVGGGVVVTDSAGKTTVTVNPPFSSITAATNANALVVGTGGSLTTSGTGTVTANRTICTGSEYLKADGTCASPSAATASGNDTEVQFNDTGSQAGDAGLTYNKTTNVLTASGGFVGALTGNVTGNVTGNLTGTASAATLAAGATALAANGANCAGGSFAAGVDASGVSEGCAALPTTIAGTSGEVTASAPTGAVVLSLPAEVNLSSHTLRVPNSDTLPGSCAAGEVFLDTNATTGQRWYACESGSFVQQGGAGAGAGDINAIGDCASGDCFTVTGSGTSQVFRNATSGTITVTPVTGALGTRTLSLPASTGTLATQDEVTTHAALSGTSAHSATTTNTASRIVSRDASGNFAAGTITATLTGNAATSTALAANGANCAAGSFPLGVDASGAAESCTDGATQTELNTHSALTGTSAHSAASANTASQIVARDGSGNFSAGTITASLTGNVTGNVTGNSDTAAALAANPTDCTQSAEIMAFSQTIAANGDLTCAILVARKTADPTVDDDTGDGYIVGTKWINTSGVKVFEATAVGSGAAAWQQTFPNSQISGLSTDCVTREASATSIECGSMTDDGSTVSTGSASLCVGTDCASGYEVGLVRAYWDGGALTPDGTQCADPTKQTINSGPVIYTFSCADNAASIFYGQVQLLRAISTATFKLTLWHGTTETITFAGDFSAQCRAAGTAPNATFGTAVAADVAITTANNLVETTSAAVTPNGTCSIGSTLFFRYVVDAANFSANAANAKVISVFMAQAS